MMARRSLVLLAASLVMVSSAMLAPTRALAEEARTACPAISRWVILGKDPVLVNPGAKCRLQLAIPVSREGAGTCLCARETGSNATLGPFCAGASGPTEGLPIDTEWL